MSRFLTLGIVTLFLAGIGYCQSTSGTYRIQIEDQLGIAVFDEPQIQGAVTVLPDGNVTPPFAPSIRAEGKTTAELETELADVYVQRLKLRNPKVTVTVLKIRRLMASIGGNVERPSQYEMRPGMSVRDLITIGGARDELGDLRHATFKRKEWIESIPIDLYSMIVNNDLSQNYEVKDGDQVMVPPKKKQLINIFGEVGTPRNVQWEDGMNLNQALAIAGGTIPNRAKKTKVLVVRPKPGNPDVYYMIQCNMVAYEKGDFAQNISLYPGDSVIVTNNGNPNFELLNSVANFLFILDRFGIRFLPQN